MTRDPDALELVRLLRACAKGTDHIKSGQAVIFSAGADMIERLTPPAEARRELARRLRELAQDDEDNMRFEQPARRVEIALMRRAADMLEE